MGLLHHPLRSAVADATATPVGFCDACGLPTYRTDSLEVTEGTMVLSLHDSCAASLEDKIGSKLYGKAHGNGGWRR